MDDSSVSKLDDDVVGCDREVTVTAAEGLFFRHNEPRLHHECHDRATGTGGAARRSYPPVPREIDALVVKIPRPLTADAAEP